MRRIFLSLTVIAAAFAAPALADEVKPAFEAGDTFHFIRETRDLIAGTAVEGTVSWEALESTVTGHRIRVVETTNGKNTVTLWRYNRDNNPLAQELGNGCEYRNDPHGERYQWPLKPDSAWEARFTSAEFCEGAIGSRPIGECEVTAKVVANGTYDGLRQEGVAEHWPAVALERVVICTSPANPGFASIRWEKELLCPTLGMRCVFEADTVILKPDEATDDALDDYRSAPDRQRFTNRIYDRLKRLELSPSR